MVLEVALVPAFLLPYWYSTVWTSCTLSILLLIDIWIISCFGCYEYPVFCWLQAFVSLSLWECDCWDIGPAYRHRTLGDNADTKVVVPSDGDFPGGASGKEPDCQRRRHKRLEFDPWVRKIPWRRHGNPLQYSRLENPMDRGALWPTVHGIAKSWTGLKQLSTHAPTPWEAWDVFLGPVGLSSLTGYLFMFLSPPALPQTRVLNRND